MGPVSIFSACKLFLLLMFFFFAGSPLLVADNGSMTTANPTVWPMIPGYQAPFCADRQNPFLEDKDCTMTIVSHKVKGRTQYFFEAPHDGCEFSSEIDFFSSIQSLFTLISSANNCGRGK